MFQRTKLCTSLLVAFSGTVALTSMPAQAQNAERVEVTGSRIKRADSEGALPVSVISRQELEASGATTVAEFIRNSTFSSSGNFRPQSGSSAQSFAGVDLRGLGSSRTLVLMDGRRLPKSPTVGDAVNMNAVPMAVVERIEILTDGASAIYGSDAIGGVINIITRKDFSGVQVAAGLTKPDNRGGDKTESSAIVGMSGDKGRMLLGVSQATRDIVFTVDRPWPYTKGTSSYGNNYQLLDDEGNAISGIRALEPNKCDYGPGFYYLSRCRYDFNLVAADEAATSNTSVFAYGEYQIEKDWTAYLRASVSRLTSFGRYAPVPGNVVVAKDSPNNPTGGTNDVLIWHRFAAAGNRDTTTENNEYSALAGIQGRVGNVDLDFGLSLTTNKGIETGRGYIVKALAEKFINSGEYNLYNPYATPEDVLNSIRFNTGRDQTWRQKEFFGTATTELFKLGGGSAAGSFGVEYREETYKDLYDPLSEAGQVLGSAGNSAAGSRKIGSAMGEISLPFTKEFDMSLAARYEKYSDYGSDFSPKVSARFRPSKNLTLRASAGTGFRAPSLPVLHAKTSFSAESVVDPASCAVLGSGDPIQCRSIEEVQVSTFVAANPNLKSEKSKQFSFGAVYDPMPWLSVKADYWNTTITDAISYISAQDVVDRDLGIDQRPIPAGLGIQRNAVDGSIIRVDTGYRNDGELKASGLDLNFLVSNTLGSFGKLRNDLSVSYVLDWKSNGVQTAGDQGLPRMRATLSNEWTRGPWEVTWNVNFVGKNGKFTTFTDPVTGLPVLDEDGVAITKDTRLGSYTTHDLQVAFDTPIKGGKLSVGVLNVFGKIPTLLDYSGRNFNFYLYDAYGAQPYVRFVQKF